jgi:hypothetical protein
MLGLKSNNHERGFGPNIETRRTQMPLEAFILLGIILCMSIVVYDELFKGGE